MQISVIIPVYNGGDFIKDAILSIVTQTFTNFEVIIIDDGSDDQTPEIIDTFAKQDPRIIISRNIQPSGICYSLNKAISLANCELIARMDADDISRPVRLEKQIAFFKSDPSLIIVGSAIELINDKGEIIGHHDYPTTHEDIVAAMADYSPFCHPSVMFRKHVVMKAGGYREQYRDAEDYDLWLRLKDMGKLANTQEYLLRYRIHPGQITINKLRNQHRMHMRARREALGLGDYTFLEKLRGCRGTLGNKYLSLAYQQQKLGEPEAAFKLGAYSLLYSPMSPQTWHFIGNQIRKTRTYNYYRWYLNKLRKIVEY